MKNLIISVILVLIFLASGLTQTALNQVWNTNFTWGGSSDNISELILKSSGIYINGWLDGNVGIVHSAIAKFNSLDGSTVWKKTDTTSLSLSDLSFCVLENVGKIFYLSSSLSGAYFYLVIRDKNTGEIIRMKPLSSATSFFEYGSDSVIAVNSSSNTKVIILNNNGDSTRSFPLGYSLTAGMVTLKRSGNYIWIFGLYYSSQYNSFVEKRNIFSGEIIWRREFLNFLNCYGDIDSAGNTFVGNTDMLTSITTMYKLDPMNNIVWQKNYSGDLYGLVVNKKNNVVITCGEKKTDKTRGLVYARNMTTGDSVFAFIVTWNQNSLYNGVTAIISDTTNNFYIAGKDRLNTWGPNTCHVRKYYYDSSIGIVEIGNENPEEFKLSQNYPNPFNPNTKIQFSLPKKSIVTLKVYDILGREITTLVNGKMQEGVYAVDFDGNNLPSGIYFYRLEADRFNEVKKMILTK